MQIELSPNEKLKSSGLEKLKSPEGMSELINVYKNIVLNKRKMNLIKSIIDKHCKIDYIEYECNKILFYLKDKEIDINFGYIVDKETMYNSDLYDYKFYITCIDNKLVVIAKNLRVN